MLEDFTALSMHAGTVSTADIPYLFLRYAMRGRDAPGR